MFTFIKTAHYMYPEILKNGPFMPVTLVPETTSGSKVIAATWVPKDPSQYTDTEREKVSLDNSLMLILTDSLDMSMYNNVVNCTTVKQIWETIEILCEGTEEVKENQRQLLVSQYETFMSKQNESITEVFERFNKLINDLQMHGKQYETKEKNLKFLLTLPDHLESKISAIKEGRDLSKLPLETLYGILKTYELEFFQRKSILANRGKMANVSNALIVKEPMRMERSSTSQKQKDEEVEDDDVEESSAKDESDEDEYYTIEELERMDNKSLAFMAKKFGNLRFKKNRSFKPRSKPNFSSFNKGTNPRTSSQRGYKTGTVDRSKIRCFNCDELGHLPQSAESQR